MGHGIDLGLTIVGYHVDVQQGTLVALLEPQTAADFRQRRHLLGLPGLEEFLNAGKTLGDVAAGHAAGVEGTHGHNEGIWVEEISENGQVIEKFAERLRGRFPVNDIVDPATGEVLCPADRMLDEEDAKMLEKRGITRVEIRTVLTCRAKSGVCAKCYGMNLASGKPVGTGEAVGIIAAQSIGEPGTQLTMRTFHTGGVAGGDITQGLPRVEELFEARKPKKMATLVEIAGRLRFEESRTSPAAVRCRTASLAS